MLRCAHPEVLAPDWLAPVALGRTAEVAEGVRLLVPNRSAAQVPSLLTVAGPSGSGSSTVARRCVREAADLLRGLPGGLPPRIVAVRTSNLAGPQAVATALLQRLDDGFRGRGFPVAEILAGFLRRLRREGRPAFVLLDDIGVGGPELGAVVRALLEPDRFLPEGESGLPGLRTVLAGTAEALHTVQSARGREGRCAPVLTLAPYPPEILEAIVRDRLERALGGDGPPDLAGRITERSLAEGGGARHAIDLVRREMLGSPASGNDPRRPPSPQVAVESRVVRAIGVASRGSAASLAAVKSLEAKLARAQGERPLPTTTLWRRIVRLERAGYLRREIRTGGIGGSRSVVRVLLPIDEWVTAPHWPGTRPAVGSWAAPAGIQGEVPGRPAFAVPPLDDGADE